MTEQQDVWAPAAEPGEGSPTPPPTPSGKLPDVVNVLSEVFDDLMANLVGYLLSGVGVAVVSVVAVVVILAIVFGGTIGGAVIGQAIGSPDAVTMVVLLLTVVAYLVAIVGLIVVTAPMGASIARAVLAHQEQGEALGIGASFSRMGVDVVQIILLTVLSFVLAMIGMMFCYLPGLAVSLFLGFAFPAVVVHRASAVEAIGLSFRHVRKHFVWHLGYWGLSLAILFVGSAIPFLGMLISLPVYYAFQIKAYTRVFPPDRPLAAVLSAA